MQTVSGYFRTRYKADRQGTVGLLASLVAFILSIAYLKQYLPWQGTMFFSLAASEIADRIARWFV